MSLFSSKKRTYVGTTVSRAIPPETEVESIQVGILKALYKNGNISEYLMEELTSGIGTKAERMYRYAENGNYTYGLPSGEVYSSIQGASEVEAVIEALEGGPVTLEYSHYGPANDLHIGWAQLFSSYGYNPDTNELETISATKGKTVYLQDMQIAVSTATYDSLNIPTQPVLGSYPNAGFTPTRGSGVPLNKYVQYFIDDTVVGEELRVTYIWEESPVEMREELYAAVHLTETIVLPLTGFTENADYFHARYVVGGVTKLWMYEAGIGTYPTLDAFFESPPVVSGSYFPFLYFRFGKQSMATLEGTDAYTTSKRLAKFLNMDYAGMIDAINTNPDIDDVEQAFLTFAVPPGSQDPLDLRYLFEYFSVKYLSQNPAGKSQLWRRTFGRLFREDSARNVEVIQDSRFKFALSNDGIYKRLVPGSIGPVGTYTGTTGTSSTTLIYETNSGEETVELTRPFTVTTYIYRYQISASVYEELEVVDLSLRYYIFNGYSTLGDEVDDILLVPLDHSITENYSIAERERLYQRAMHYVFNSVQIIKISWYQTSLFKAIIIAAAVVLMVFTYGQSWQATAAAIAAGYVSIQMIIVMIVVGIIEAIITAAAVKLFVKAVGLENAFILAIIAAVVAVYTGYSDGGIASSPWAQQLLTASTSLSSGAASVLEDEFENLLGEKTTFDKYIEEQTKLLDTANDLLKSDSLLSPLTILGEAPIDFYNRTVHSGNIGVVGISAIGSFVDVALTLPKLSDTIRNPYDGRI